MSKPDRRPIATTFAIGLAAVPAGTLSSGPVAAETASPALPEILFADGLRYAPQQARGKIVIVNFWASWCGPCRQELPSLDQMAAHWPDVIVIAASVDADPADARAAFDGKYPHLRLGFSSMAAVSRYGALGIPYSVAFDKDGREHARIPRAIDWNDVGPEKLGHR